MRELKRTGLSILLVEQNLYSALAVADKAYIMETGRIVHHGPARELAAAPDVLRRYLGVG